MFRKFIVGDNIYGMFMILLVLAQKVNVSMQLENLVQLRRELG